jgi:hypothetical protein
MLSSVPITIEGVNYSLQFTPQDVDDIEISRGNTPLVLLIQKEQMLCTGTLASFLYHGLKKPGQIGPHGEPVRALTQGARGYKEEALAMVFRHIAGKPLDSQSDLINAVYRALAVGNWYSLSEMMKHIEASTSVPQGDSIPKNSEEPGSNLSSQ